jgi:hypothetical protein
MTTYENIKLGLLELIKTFSNRPSFLSSKRIERFVVFTTMLSLTISYIILHIKTIGATDFILVVGTWMAYAGFNIIQNRRDIKLQNNTESN